MDSLQHGFRPSQIQLHVQSVCVFIIIVSCCCSKMLSLSPDLLLQMIMLCFISAVADCNVLFDICSSRHMTTTSQGRKACQHLCRAPVFCSRGTDQGHRLMCIPQAQPNILYSLLNNSILSSSLQTDVTNTDLSVATLTI